MIDCTGLRPLLSFYLEKETGPLETLEARRHLDSCEACRTRARRMAETMARCDAIPEPAPTLDIARMVMGRLSSFKRASREATPLMAAKWSGLAIVLSAALGVTLTRLEPMSRALSRPVAFLAGLVAGGEGDRLGKLVGGAVPLLPSAIAGRVPSDLAPATAMDATVTVQVLGTALVFGLGLAIPVALLTAWLLHRESAS
jgi:predicted anti-sigma-YlaC factor YlaD